MAPGASILTHTGYSWEASGHFGETLGLPFGTLGLHLGTLGVHVGVLWALWCVALDPSGHFYGKERIQTVSSLYYTPNLTLKSGIYTKMKPNNIDKKDILQEMTIVY